MTHNAEITGYLDRLSSVWIGIREKHDDLRKNPTRIVRVEHTVPLGLF